MYLETPAPRDYSRSAGVFLAEVLRGEHSFFRAAVSGGRVRRRGNVKIIFAKIGKIRIKPFNLNTIRIKGRKKIMQEEKTGIVRRIDALGRLVIPKEMRKVLKWNDNDPLEMYTLKNEIVIKKYSPMASVAAVASSVGEGIEELTEKHCVITDMDNVVYSSGKYKDMVGKKISENLDRTIRGGKSLLIIKSEGGEPVGIIKGENPETENQIIVPIISDGYYYGSVIIYDKDKDHKFNAGDVRLLRLGAFILAAQV